MRKARGPEVPISAPISVKLLSVGVVVHLQDPALSQRQSRQRGPDPFRGRLRSISSSGSGIAHRVEFVERNKGDRPDLSERAPGDDYTVAASETRPGRCAPKNDNLLAERGVLKDEARAGTEEVADGTVKPSWRARRASTGSYQAGRASGVSGARPGPRILH